MPKSKRAKVIHLSKTQKKGKALSRKHFDDLQTAAQKYQYVFVFEVDNMRNNHFKEVRKEFSDSRIIIGKTKVMAKALGSSAEDEPLPNLSSLHSLMHGHVGLLFTSRPPAAICDFFESYSRTSFARAGVVASQDIAIPAGQVYSRAGQIPVEDDVPLPAAMEPTVRKWALPTRLDKGKVMLDSGYTICKEGDLLNSHQTALLKIFGIELAEFAIRLKGFYDATSQKVNIFNEESEAKNALMSG